MNLDPRHQHLRALADECRAIARLLRSGSVLAYLTIFGCVYGDRAGWAIIMGCFAVAFEFLRFITMRDYRTLCYYLPNEEP
jgi:hypothetical protein